MLFGYSTLGRKDKQRQGDGKRHNAYRAVVFSLKEHDHKYPQFGTKFQITEEIFLMISRVILSISLTTYDKIRIESPQTNM